ncbi:DNA polymerase epsilon catalytic subunit 1 [Planococcus citri]|uniref:DNA polymerase epsilon catalytic subunit 1 n=1 Tax=Planococcus citri TaxID=170843 RepID=UPI0031F7C2B5
MPLFNSGRLKQGRNDQNNFTITKEDSADLRIKQSLENDSIDSKYGFNRVKDHKERTGFLINMHSNEVIDEDKRLISVVDYYFIEDDGSRFKVTLPFQPYFYLLTKKENIQEVTGYLSKKFAGSIIKIEQVLKEDLDLPNHLIGLKQLYLKVSFTTVTELTKIKQAIMPSIRKNKEREKSNTFYNEMLTESLANRSDAGSIKKVTDHLENIIDIREYDVPYHVRVSIDMKICVGVWYTIQSRGANDPPIITRRDDIIDRPDLIVLAFDIETSKLPLKFPDANTDQIMMISYMIDAQGFLITNREIISEDVDDFEYTPKPEFEGFFTIFNEPNEEALINRFFEHVNDVKPHIFVTYNGDFFDWPFVETRAAVHGLDMSKEIGFAKSKDGVYACRPAMHMDCLCWVKRDSYLPVGSQNLKAVAKAKLRYDPVELDPEDMCRLACEQPQILSNYSVSDAVATYYLYMKYVHPFIFALCTIIPMEADEVLRKGSGTLCEALLMVEAFHANIIFPNKQEQTYNKLSDDGHVLDQETYVGGHVEALESGVFRADIPCRFRLDPQTLTKLIDCVEQALTHAIEEEEKIPLKNVTNFDEIVSDVKSKLTDLKNTPGRLENPIIYHLDVGAMYPNIILTNRLQPSAMVDEMTCAACDYNKPDAKCQRNMVWMWRGEIMPATRSEFQRIQQQLEIEKFPPRFPGGPPRAFHQLSKEERATFEKKRLSEYCRKVYKKTHVTRIEERTTTVCQKENSFYVDTVRAFRDRRYEYKKLGKGAKQQVSDAVKKGDPAEIKSAKNREVLYDSLQLAHKCILNSFYGYVMRRGSRWYSMEMGGIVCCTGASIITKAREIIECVGRPLELDTDGIWCILPASFPENYTVTTDLPGKSSVVISYPNAVLNSMVKEHYTNHAYHELVDKENTKYIIRSENSIFFEVDGPYRGMVLPASKEEGKKLKKRYAVFNFDGTLAELKGFEVKRRGELQLIKIFQSSVFDSFLKGDTLEKCYESVATVANYWLDVLYNKARNMPDSELFELISENRSMSRKLEDYGSQKSTSISTAKRLAEFLGDQMVKDAGLACRYIISRKPEGSPVTERAIPLAIFQSEASVKRHYLRKWMKDTSIDDNIDIRDVLDWDYYIERLNGAIQKIITIPAALQGLDNPVERVRHPDWLHKKLMNKNDVCKQRKINDMFKLKPKKPENEEPVVDSVGFDSIPNNDVNDTFPDSVEIADDTPSDPPNVEMPPPPAPDIEDIGRKTSPMNSKSFRVQKKKRKRDSLTSDVNNDTATFQEALGPPPSCDDFQEWLEYQKKKWQWQKNQRNFVHNGIQSKRFKGGMNTPLTNRQDLSGFFRRTQRTLLDSSWEILQVCETGQPGVLKLWALVGNELHNLQLTVPRTFYVNQRKPREEIENAPWVKCNRILPRSRPVFNLYQFGISERLYLENTDELVADLSAPDIEGIYETHVKPELRALIKLGCMCAVEKEEAKKLAAAGLQGLNSFSLDQLQMKNLPYLKDKDSLKYIYLYCHRAPNSTRAMFGLFIQPNHKAAVYVLDSVRTNQMPNMSTLYANERNNKIERGHEEANLPPKNFEFEVRVETDQRQIFRQIQKKLQAYRDERKGPTILVIQSLIDTNVLTSEIQDINDFPYVLLFMQESPESVYLTLDWQRVSARTLVKHYLSSVMSLQVLKEQCRYLHLPIGNLPVDPTLFGADIFYSRHLLKHNFVLWISETEKPDLGGREADDNRMLTEFSESSSTVVNNSNCYTSYCVELELDGLAVTTILQSHHVQDIEGTSSAVSFEAMPQASLEEMVEGTTAILPSYDETALCSAAFKVLRSMVNVWLRDVSIHQNPYADFQIIHFYRWIRSTNALLYDPALRRTLYNLMKKLFMQLVAEFKRLGSIIVFANFNRIIICTKKHSLEEAICYVKFVVQSITNRELFHSLQITFGQCWPYLMWLDPWNYAGVKGKLPTTLVEHSTTLLEDDLDLTSLTENDEDENNFEIQMNWNMMEFLPEDGGLRTYFNDIVAGYIHAIYTHLCSNDAACATPKRRRTTLSQLTQTTQLGVGAHEETTEFAKEFISSELTDKLFLITQRIHKKYPVMEIKEDTFDSPFTILRSKNEVRPALEFVKSICKVLSLDSAINEDIVKLRKNLLRLIGVGDFSDIAVWEDPSLSWVLPEVICKGCNHCRDIDLCKDAHRVIINGISMWQCPICQTNYENSVIEHMLIDALNRKAMAYVLQDIQCKKCLQIKMDDISKYCSCSGSFKTLIDQTEISAHLNTFGMIAKYFKMSLLEQMVDWITQVNRSSA